MSGKTQSVESAESAESAENAESAESAENIPVAEKVSDTTNRQEQEQNQRIHI